MPKPVQLHWDDFKEICYQEDDHLPLEASILERITDQDGALSELFDTSSVTISVAGVKYVVSVQVHKE